MYCALIEDQCFAECSQCTITCKKCDLGYNALELSPDRICSNCEACEAKEGNK
jgi:hypothetical protein